MRLPIIDTAEQRNSVRAAAQAIAIISRHVPGTYRIDVAAADDTEARRPYAVQNVRGADSVLLFCDVAGHAPHTIPGDDLRMAEDLIAGAAAALPGLLVPGNLAGAGYELHVADVLQLATTTERGRAARQYEQAALTYAKETARLAAMLLRQILPGAQRLIFDKYYDDSSTGVTLLLVTGVDDQPLWYNRHAPNDAAEEQFAAVKNNLEIDIRAVETLRGLLAEAYDATGDLFDEAHIPGFDGADGYDLLSLDIAALGKQS